MVQEIIIPVCAQKSAEIWENGNMRKQGNKLSPKVYNTQKIDTIDIKGEEMLHKEF